MISILKDKSKKFLATTALDEFWDTSKPLLFLGDWCKLHNKKKIWKELQADIIDSELHEASSSLAAYHNTISVYEELIPVLSNWLNKIHKKSHSLRYWKIILGPFLLSYIQVISHRLNSLNLAYQQHPNLETIGLDASSYKAPINTHEFFLLAGDSDAWNLQIYSQLITLLYNPQLICGDYIWQKEMEQRRNLLEKKSTYQKHTKLVLNLLSWVVNLFPKRAIGLAGCSHEFSKKNLLKLFLFSRFRIVPLEPMSEIKELNFFSDKPNLLIRNELPNLAVQSDFATIVLETLKYNLPLNFIEHYSDYVRNSNECFPYRVNVIVSTTWLQDDVLKFWGAAQAENGTKLVDVQHGGGYGQCGYCSHELLERTNCDKFISWGWENTEEVISAPSILICERLAERNNALQTKDDKKKLVLWTITETDRYLTYIGGYLTHMRPKYFEWQARFANKISAEVSSVTKLRLRPNSKYIDYLTEMLPKVSVVLPDGRGSFFSQLEEARILVVDNLGTVYHYGLVFNIPTILFFDDQLFQIREEARYYFDELERVGIYHKSPESAAEKLNSIYDNYQDWWGSAEVQNARKIFCEQFAKSSEPWIKEWSEMLIKISKNKFNYETSPRHAYGFQ